MLGLKTCFFIGHRDSEDAVSGLLAQEVDRHITEYGVTDFIVGHYGRFDLLAASAVIAARVRHPEISLTLLLPYYSVERPMELSPGFDRTLFPPGMETVPKRLAIIRANRWALAQSDFLIAYVSHPSGGSRAVLEAALRPQRRGLMRVTNLSGEYPV